MEELIDLEEPGWPLVLSWFHDAKNPVEVLPAERSQGEATLLAVQVTTRSPMGAIALECGGILFDRGWVRLLGAGCPRMKGNLASWNGLDGTDPQPKLEGAFVIAHDAVGGFFALNGGGLGPAKLNVHYGAPDSLSWEDTEMGYSDFVHWLAHGDLAGYYEDLRWPGWEEEVAALSGDRGICVWPPLFTVEGKQARSAGQHRKAVPLRELWALWHSFRDQLGPG